MREMRREVLPLEEEDLARIGRGGGVAALFNARAKRVTASAVRALRKALPDALVLASEDLEQAHRQMKTIAAADPWLLLSGGGDGAVVQLLTLWRAAARGRPFPLIGVLKLGTGNAWARVSGADRYFSLVPMLPLLPRSLPGQTFDLLEVDGSLCHFAGAGWDAQVLIDYQRNLDKRSSQLIGSRLASRFHRGLTGYFYATWRLTLPGEIDRTRRFGRTAALIESTAPLAFRVDSRGEARPVEAAAGEHPRLYDGPFGVIGMATEPELGFGLRAFPFARMKPGFMHLRIFAGGVLSAFRHPVRLWRGDLPPPPGIEDFLVSRARLRFSRPVAIQIAGDAREERASVEIGVAPDRVVLVDWREAARSVSSRKA